MYYVRPDWRESGLGTMLFEKAMEIGKHENMALNGGKRSIILLFY